MDWRDLLLAAVIRGVDSVAPWFPMRKEPGPEALPAARPGISILIPERGTPALLAACLTSVEVACAVIDESIDVHVLVNGCPPRDYDALTRRYRFVTWHFEKRPLGFHGAIRRGLEFVTHEWVYLLNSDMTLAQDTLASVLPLRDHRTFAIASQIFFADRTRRREETGWTDYRIEAALTQHFDRTPETDGVRGHLYASGGASLFRVAPLRRYVASSADYAPFYFEDADWGLQAARAGYAVKFCPQSIVSHVHRATIKQFYAPQEIERIIRRNQLLFEARHGLGGRARMLTGEDPRTRRELTSTAALLGIALQRWRSRQARMRGFSPAQSCATAYPRSFVASWPTAMIFVQGSPRGAFQDAMNDAKWRISHAARTANVVLILEGEPTELPEGPLNLCAAVHVIGSLTSSEHPHAREPGLVRQKTWWRLVYGMGVSPATAVGGSRLELADSGEIAESAEVSVPG